jgi:hypothetical protein
MNDFSELENELKKLRPAQPSPGLFGRIEQAIIDLTDEGVATGKVIRPSRFKVSWIALGAGLAAAAIFLIFARIDTDQASRQTNRVAQNTPAPTPKSTTVPAGYIPDGATHVVYHTQDEGLHYRAWSEAPVRRVRTQKRETLQWRDAQTGASLQVSYPSEEVVLTPVSGQ